MKGAFLASLNVRGRYKMDPPKVRVSMSSEPAAYTAPSRARDAHWAVWRQKGGEPDEMLTRNRYMGKQREADNPPSASLGATITGIPINLSKRLHSSLCSFVTLTVRRENRSRSSAVPVSLASFPSSFASARFSNRFESCGGDDVN